MSAEYTKGPWEWRGDERQIDEFTSLQNSNGEYVLYPDYRCGDYGMSISPYIECTQGANARLIASAPELLEALERLKRNHHLLLSGKPVRDVAETEAEVNAAITKARGESND